jgi:hypothetical protein
MVRLLSNTGVFGLTRRPISALYFSQILPVSLSLSLGLTYHRYISGYEGDALAVCRRSGLGLAGLHLSRGCGGGAFLPTLLSPITLLIFEELPTPRAPSRSYHAPCASHLREGKRYWAKLTVRYVGVESLGFREKSGLNGNRVIRKLLLYNLMSASLFWRYFLQLFHHSWLAPGQFSSLQRLPPYPSFKIDGII